jgi:hypothetical protein
LFSFVNRSLSLRSFSCSWRQSPINIRLSVDKLDHIMLYRTFLAMSGMEFELTTLEAIGTPGNSHDTLSFRTKNLVFRSFVTLADTYSVFILALWT